MRRLTCVLFAVAVLLVACESGSGSEATEAPAAPPTTAASISTGAASEPTTAAVAPATVPPATAARNSGEPVRLDWVAMDSAQSGWARTDAGAIVRSEDGGATWQPAGVDEPIGADAILYTAGAYAWIAVPSDRGIRLWHTTTAGAEWASAELPRDPVAGVFLPHDLVFPDVANGWLLVQLDGAAGTVFVDLYATTDGGASWARVAGPPPSDENAALESGRSLDMDFSTAGRGWVTKDIGAASGAHIAATADGGATWRDVMIPGVASRFCATRDPYARDVLGGSVLVECDDGSAWFAQTPDDGARWELYPMPEPAVQAVRFEDGVFAWGDSLMEWLGPPEAFQVVYRFPLRPSAVSIPDALHVFAVVDGELWRSDDQGRNWSVVEAFLTT